MAGHRRREVLEAKRKKEEREKNDVKASLQLHPGMTVQKARHTLASAQWADEGRVL